MQLPFEEAAAEELESAVVWYERERPGFGLLLFDEVKRKVAQAAVFPESGLLVPGTEHEIRVHALARFPYSVVTASIRGQRAVLALAHHARTPGYWNDRLK